MLDCINKKSGCGKTIGTKSKTTDYENKLKLYEANK